MSFPCPAPGLAVTTGRQREAKELQVSSRHVYNRGLLFDEFVARKQNSRGQSRIDAVIAAPRLDVVLENLRGDFAHHRVPRGAIAGSITDNQVRRVLRIRSTINFVRNEHARDRSEE